MGAFALYYGGAPEGPAGMNALLQFACEAILSAMICCCNSARQDLRSGIIPLSSNVCGFEESFTRSGSESSAIGYDRASSEK